jgi:hypothetical protein
MAAVMAATVRSFSAIAIKLSAKASVNDTVFCGLVFCLPLATSNFATP